MNRVYEYVQLSADRWRVTNGAHVSYIQYGTLEHVEDVVGRMEKRWQRVGRDSHLASWRDAPQHLGRSKGPLRLEAERLVAAGVGAKRGELAAAAKDLAARFGVAVTTAASALAVARKGLAT